MYEAARHVYHVLIRVFFSADVFKGYNERVSIHVFMCVERVWNKDTSKDSFVGSLLRGTVLVRFPWMALDRIGCRLLEWFHYIKSRVFCSVMVCSQRLLHVCMYVLTVITHVCMHVCMSVGVHVFMCRCRETKVRTYTSIPGSSFFA